MSPSGDLTSAPDAQIAVARADGARGRIDLSIALSLLGLAVYALSPYGGVYPAAIVSIASFAVFPALLPRARPARIVFCPLNWAHLISALVLVICPVLVSQFEPVVFDRTITILPSAGATNFALILASLAFLGLCAGLSLGRPVAVAARDGLSPAWRIPLRTVVATLTVIGSVGFLISFGGFAGIAAYFSSPTNNVGAASQFAAVGPLASIALAMRACLGFVPVILIAVLMQRRAAGGSASAFWVRALPLGAVLVLVNLSFSYNRAAVAVPVVALIAAYSLIVRPIGLRRALLLGLIGIVVVTGLRAYRNLDASPASLLVDDDTRAELVQNTRIIDEIQLYGGSPQFLAFLVERTDYAEDLTLGRTVLSSTLLPVPGFSDAVEDTSGIGIFNRLIYDQRAVVDQIIPFIGELFLDGDIPLVVFGFVLVGVSIRFLQERFVRAPTALQAYVWQYAGVWVAFLGLGSIAIPSQILVNFGAPIVFTWLAARVNRRVGRRRATGVGSRTGALA